MVEWLRIPDREQLHELEIMIRGKFPGALGFTDLVLDEQMQYWMPIVFMKFTRDISLEGLLKFCDDYGKIRGYKLEVEIVNPELGAKEVWEYVMTRDSLKSASV